MRRSARFVISSSATLALLFVEVGCWSSPTSSPTPLATKPSTAPSTETPGDLAERMLRTDAPFDLRFPAKVAPRREGATKALLHACRTGHHPSCWLLLQMASSQSALRVGLADVISQCQKRDFLSCRAIPPFSPHPMLPAGLPGERGRRMYQMSRPPNDDEAVALRSECRSGFAYSCKVLAERSSDPAERQDMHDKMVLAARQGCGRKISDDCELVNADWPEDDRLMALDWNCQVRRSNCHRLGAAMLAAGRVEDARNEYERACQYGPYTERCLELAQLYRDGSYPSPFGAAKRRSAPLPVHRSSPTVASVTIPNVPRHHDPARGGSPRL